MTWLSYTISGLSCNILLCDVSSLKRFPSVSTPLIYYKKKNQMHVHSCGTLPRDIRKLLRPVDRKCASIWTHQPAKAS